MRRNKRKIHRMAECTSCGQRIEDPEYVNGDAYCSFDAEVQRDYNRAGALERDLRKKKKLIRQFD